MKNLLFILLGSLALQAYAATDVYLKIPDIDGETKETSEQSGLPTGKRQHKPVTVTKPIDKATPMLSAAGTQAGADANSQKKRIDKSSPQLMRASTQGDGKCVGEKSSSAGDKSGNGESSCNNGDGKKIR